MKNSGVRLFTLVALLLAFISGCKKEAAKVPTLSTGSITSITLTSAITGGNVTSDGGAALTGRGLCYGMNPNPTILNSVVTDGSLETGVFSFTLVGLTRATKYYVRAYATNSVGTSYGAEINFSTTTPTPTITTTQAVTAVTTTSAVTGGTITDDGGTILTSSGVCWSNTNKLPTILDGTTKDGTVAGSYSSTITGLIMNTTYYVRAYATNSAGTSYGSVISFSTKGIPLLTTAALSNFIGTQATSGSIISSDGGFSITMRGVCWSTNTNPTLAGSYVHNLDSSSVLINLIPGTVYHVRAYATNSVGTAYGNDLSFNSGQILGSTFAGGLVFYNNGKGGGLVSAGTDQSEGAPWGCQGTFITLTSTAIGTGQANTSAIINNCSSAGTAARLCSDLILNSYDDWFLPSYYELMLVKSIILPTVSPSWIYWTSSEATAVSAHYIGYNRDGACWGCGLGAYFKSELHRVRAVRSF